MRCDASHSRDIIIPEWDNTLATTIFFLNSVCHFGRFFNCFQGDLNLRVEISRISPATAVNFGPVPLEVKPQAVSKVQPNNL